MCMGGGGAAATQYKPAPVAPAPKPVYAQEPAAANPEVSAVDLATKAREAAKKRLGTFGNATSLPSGNSSYRQSSVATFGAVGV